MTEDYRYIHTLLLVQGEGDQTSLIHKTYDMKRLSEVHTSPVLTKNKAYTLPEMYREGSLVASLGSDQGVALCY